MELDYVVLTSVNRDDLADEGAGHFAACIQACRELAPKTMVETLVPDFHGRPELLDILLDARPDVFAHNVETVPRLQHPVRDPRANWENSIRMLSHAKSRHFLTKTSLQVGHGESADEITEAMRLLREHDVDFLTIGQYLRPSESHLGVQEYVHPDVFARWEREGKAMGFRYVASGPLVRSSYKAGEFFIHEFVRKHGAEA
jgi:lipoic acid synthetase